jgi:hypothetical protein
MLLLHSPRQAGRTKKINHCKTESLQASGENHDSRKQEIAEPPSAKQLYD